MTDSLADYPRVRRAAAGDESDLLALQGTLERPNPDLLRGALDGVGRVLVSTAGDGASEAPVGYLLALGRVAAPDGATARQASTDREAGGEGAYIAELAVAPAHRREGRATELLSALADGLDGGWITLTVAPDNEPARRLYASAGFRVLERRPEFFEGEPALVMGRRVAGL